MSTISVTLPVKMSEQLNRFAKKKQQKKSEIIRDALRRYFAQREFRSLREKMVPHAQKMGIFTDEDVFKIVS
jgi:metal-responsive CopG/Arc/MetJ family transcriptional regulator